MIPYLAGPVHWDKLESDSAADLPFSIRFSVSIDIALKFSLFSFPSQQVCYGGLPFLLLMLFTEVSGRVFVFTPRAAPAVRSPSTESQHDDHLRASDDSDNDIGCVSDQCGNEQIGSNTESAKP